MEVLVSVIIPVYNGEKTIRKAIESVQAQTYTRLQILVVDDCSRDATREIVGRIAKDDSRVILYENSQNLGVAATRNFACNEAQGEYIAFLDCDDYWHKEKIQHQLEYLQETKGDLCYTAYWLIKEDKKSQHMIPNEATYADILKENVICCSSVLVRKQILGNMPFTSKYFHEDLILWLQLLKQGYRAVGLNECLVAYACGGRSGNKVNAFINRWKIYRKVEKLGLAKSSYYFINYAVKGIKKYYFNSSSRS